MFNKLNAWLITRYPLLWNTRVVYLFPLVLLIHVLFYVAGYSQFMDYANLKNYKIFNIENVVQFSCLLSIVILLIWLIYYLRNNPLKAHYPISKAYMFREFVLLFLVFFSTATFFLTYQQGLFDQTKRISSDTDLIDEVNTFNLAYHFIPRDIDAFRIYNSCDSIKARDERREERRLIYLEALKSGEPLDFDFINDEPVKHLDSINPSYLYYCQLMYRSYKIDSLIYDSETNNARVAAWLKEGRKDSVHQVLIGLRQLLIKYDVSCLFDPEAQADSVFAYPDFYTGQTYFNQPEDYEEEHEKRKWAPFIESYGLSNSLDKIEEVREGFWDYKVILFILYYALSMAILLYSFRIIRLRIWFAALIGVGLWAIVLGLLFNLSDIRDEGIFYVLLFLFLAFLTAVIWLIRARENKFVSGLTFLWAIWSQLAVLPLILAIVMEAYKYDDTLKELGYRTEEKITPLYTWLKENMDIIFTSNLGLFLILLILIYIPLARRWQANPEE